MNTIDKIRAARLGGAVERCHTIPHHGSYSNAHHTWNTLILLWHLFPEHWNRASAVVMAHDVPEGIFGDIPSTTMKFTEGLKSKIGRAEKIYLSDIGLPCDTFLEDEEYEAYKACDSLELYIWCLEQRALGNMFAEECRVELEHFFEDSPLPGKANDLFLELKTAPFSYRQARLAKHYLER